MAVQLFVVFFFLQEGGNYESEYKARICKALAAAHSTLLIVILLMAKAPYKTIKESTFTESHIFSVFHTSIAKFLDKTHLSHTKRRLCSLSKENSGVLWTTS